MLNSSTSEAAAWLPEEALVSGPLPARLRMVVEQWSEHWFCQRSMEIASDPGLLSAHQVEVEHSEWHLVRDGLWVGVSRGSAPLLGGLLLDARINPGTLSQGDRTVLERLAGEAVGDLCRRLAAAFDLAGAGGRDRRPSFVPDKLERALCCRLSAGGAEPTIVLLMQAELAVRFRKSVVPRAPHEHQLRPLSEALEHQPISLSAFLGRCGLSLSEVEGLAEGDVLVLDRATDARIDLVVDRHLKPNLCRLEKNGEAYQLKILQLRTNSVEP